MSLRSINDIFAKTMIADRKRSELVAKTPYVVVREPTLNWQRNREVRYALTRLGSVHAFEITGGGRNVDYGSFRQTFRLGCVRSATPELEKEITDIDAQIKALQEKRKQVLKDKFLWLHPIPYETIQKTQQEIYEATQQ
jgi:hypothetical protein